MTKLLTRTAAYGIVILAAAGFFQPVVEGF